MFISIIKIFVFLNLFEKSFSNNTVNHQLNITTSIPSSQTCCIPLTTTIIPITNTTIPLTSTTIPLTYTTIPLTSTTPDISLITTATPSFITISPPGNLNISNGIKNKISILYIFITIFNIIMINN